MMSITQKTLVYANIPTTYYGHTVQKRLKSQYIGSPVTYPTIDVKFASEGIKTRGTWSTAGAIKTILNPITQEWDTYQGEQQTANISLTVWSETENELREICDGIEMNLKISRLGFYWPTDHVKVTGVKSIILLEPYADEFVQEHTWKAIIDFTVEYLWSIIDLDPAIRSFQYLLEEGTSADEKAMNEISSYMEGSYGMTILIKGWSKSYTVDYLLLMEDIPNSYTMDMKVVTES